MTPRRLATAACLACLLASTASHATTKESGNASFAWVLETQVASALGATVTALGNAAEPGSKHWIINGYLTGGLSLGLGLPILGASNSDTSNPFYVLGVANVLLGAASLAMTIYSHTKLDHPQEAEDVLGGASLGATVLAGPATGEQVPALTMSGRF